MLTITRANLTTAPVEPKPIAPVTPEPAIQPSKPEKPTDPSRCPGSLPGVPSRKSCRKDNNQL